MFEHITILLSFVYAIALTHLLTSSTELIWARDRVRFSGFQAIWMASAGFGAVVNWLSFGGLSIIKHWDVPEVVLQFSGAIIQYYTCSLLSLRPKEEGVIDMPAFYKRQRPAIFTAFAALMVCSMTENYWDRDHTQGLTPTVWIGENAVVLIMLVLIVVAGRDGRNQAGCNGRRPPGCWLSPSISCRSTHSPADHHAAVANVLWAAGAGFPV